MLDHVEQNDACRRFSQRSFVSTTVPALRSGFDVGLTVSIDTIDAIRVIFELLLHDAVPAPDLTDACPARSWTTDSGIEPSRIQKLNLR